MLAYQAVGIKNAVSGDGFGISKTSGSDNSCEPDNGGQFGDLGGSGKNTDQFALRKGSRVCLSFHGTGFFKDFGSAFCRLFCGEVVYFVFLTNHNAHIHKDGNRTQSFDYGWIIGNLIFNNGTNGGVLDNASAAANSKSETGNDVVDTVAGNGSVMDVTVTLGYHDTQDFDIFIGHIVIHARW